MAEHMSPWTCMASGNAFQLRGFSSPANSNSAELDALPDAIKRMLSLENASQMEKNVHGMRQAMAKFQRHPSDTGSSEVQVAILTERIQYMTKHVQVHRKDNHTSRGLMQMVQDRRKHLKYLKRQDEERYFDLIEKLGLRDAINLNPPRAFLPAKAAEQAALKVRHRAQLVEKEQRTIEKAEVVRKSYAVKREEKLAKRAANEAIVAATAVKKQQALQPKA